MHTTIDKKELINWIEELDDPAMLENLQSLKKSTEDTGDWWDDISEAAKESIRRGEEDIKAGRVTPHEEVRKAYKKWL